VGDRRGAVPEDAVRKARRRVEDLHREAPSEHRRPGGDGAPGEIEVHGPDHVDPRGRLEQTELRPDAGVEVEQLVALVTAVEAPVEVDDPAEAEAPAQVA
jgi:hypothetical protein